MSRFYTILVIDQSDSARWQLSAYINRQAELQIKGQASSFKMAMELLSAEQYDLVLIDPDLNDGDGLEIIKMVSEKLQNTKCLVYSDKVDKDYILEVARCGVDGYLVKQESLNSIFESLTRSLAGGAPISPLVAQHLLESFRAKSDAQVLVKSDAKLTKRESEVLQLVAKGYSYTEIAETLSLSYHTISTYIKIIYSKLSVCSRGAAVYEAIRSGLINVSHSQSA